MDYLLFFFETEGVKDINDLCAYNFLNLIFYKKIHIIFFKKKACMHGILTWNFEYKLFNSKCTFSLSHYILYKNFLMKLILILKKHACMASSRGIFGINFYLTIILPHYFKDSV